jgi:pimeloyl-ACP methyl ester carboxylesterase
VKAITLLALFACACTSARPPYIPRDAKLQHEPLYFYPSVGTAGHPKAGVFFLGNDLGFWSPHQKLAQRLANNGYAVVGFDVKGYLDRFPDSALLRDSVLARDIPQLVKRSLHELGADSAPIVIAGHSFGADLAFWTEAHSPMPGLVGILALGPTKRDHPTVTIRDRANLSEPTEPGSFAVAEEVGRTPPGVRIAILRGAGDKERSSDQAFIAAGGNRLSYTVIPFASHSLKSLVIAGPMIEHALDRLVGGE